VSTIAIIGLSYGAGVFSAALGFIWLNRNKPELVDKGESAVRDFKKGE
jgi:hypothetical protein